MRYNDTFVDVKNVKNRICHFVSAQGGNILDLLNCRRQAQCPGWTFEKCRALYRALFRALLVVVYVSCVVVFVSYF